MELVPKDFIDFASTWCREHIVKVDSKLGLFLRQKGLA